MNYEETLDYLYNSTPVYQKIGASAYKEGLDNTKLLDKHFDCPHSSYKTIHVGGTNGKGSVSHTLAAILQSAGYKTGLYTSPHLLDFRERIRVNGEVIDKQYVVDFIKKDKVFFEKVEPSFFELTMMMAFCYFREQKVDVAIIEVGLGGRLDSTNVIRPELSVITNIGMDHTQFLGDTLEKIAIEKAGIMKPYVPVVVGESGTEEVRTVFVDTARECQSAIVFADDGDVVLSAVKEGNGWSYQTRDYPGLYGELGGLAQLKNTQTILIAMEQLRNKGFVIPDEAVYKGFAEVIELTGLMGRWQILHSDPKVVADTGHNAEGMHYIVEQLMQEQYHTLRIILGMVNDKDIHAVLRLLPQNAHYYFTKADIPRAYEEKLLKEEAAVYKLHGESYPDVKTAVDTAMKDSSPTDLLFIGGSNFIVAEALPAFM